MGRRGYPRTKAEWWRESSHVQYHVIADVNADDPDALDVEADEKEPFYGLLEHILILHLTPNPKIGAGFETETTLTLACISRWHGVHVRSKVIVTMFDNI